ncbi:MAG TPA: transglutaminaseTgpA domain-containing protein [Acidimicrobiia bacterium]|nr:transglutaminaseTgpA domain-containing protein [Acidimicrobiia bacterium]
MVERFVWLTGLSAVVLSLARLGRLLQPQSDGPAWQIVLLAAVVLGAVFTWVARSYRLSAPAVIAVNVVGLALAVLRITAPATLVAGVIPTAETLATFRGEMAFALEIIRFGAAPVLPVAGLVAVLAFVYWLLGAFGAVGILGRRPWLVTVPAIAFYLQLATLDRRAPGLAWLIAFATVAGLSVVAMANPGNPAAGRLRARTGMLIPRVSFAAAVAVAAVGAGGAVVAANTFAASVPESGTLQWRSQTGIGSGLYGGGSFNLFVGMQQSLVSLSEDPLFYATVSDSAPPNAELYWKLITLENYDGEYWGIGDSSWVKQGATRWEREDLAFQGTTVPVAARVLVAGLRESVLPTLYSPYALRSDEDLIREGFRVRQDGSVGIDLRTNPGWEYEIEANVPIPDLNYLASTGGILSPIFAEAAEAGVFPGAPQSPRFLDRPDDITDYLELPDDTPVEVRNLARTVTVEGTTTFEKALILEAWLRDPRNFQYSTDVDTGHTSLDLADWLLDSDSNNYRTGYCEQFATAMGVMARTLGIPSRVVLGFTPGDVQQQSDGTNVIVVRERNAHAWVELWMNGQGWVRFDPTPRSDGVNVPLLADVGFDLREYVPAPTDIDSTGSPIAAGERPFLGPEIDILGGDATPALDVDTGFEMPWWGTGLLLGAVGSAMIPAYKWWRRRRRLAAIHTGNIDAAWDEIVDRLRDLGGDVPVSATPIELADSYHEDLVPLATLYTARTYGGTPRGDGRAAFEKADGRLTRRYGRWDRLVAGLQLRSLRKR